jgi:hypothetical protein
MLAHFTLPLAAFTYQLDEDGVRWRGRRTPQPVDSRGIECRRDGRAAPAGDRRKLPQ